MKDTFLLMGIFNTLLATFIYLCVYFVTWDFIVPFAWVLDIPSWTKDDRLKLLLGWLTYFIVTLIFFYTLTHQKSDINTENQKKENS